MTLRKLKVKRFETKKSKLGYFSYGVEVSGKKFLYSKVNPSKKSEINHYKNNFYRAYRGESGDNILLSIEGVSVFDPLWNKRKDFQMERNSEDYQELRRLAKNNSNRAVREALENLIGERNL